VERTVIYEAVSTTVFKGDDVENFVREMHVLELVDEEEGLKMVRASWLMRRRV